MEITLYIDNSEIEHKVIGNLIQKQRLLHFLAVFCSHIIFFFFQLLPFAILWKATQIWRCWLNATCGKYILKYTQVDWLTIRKYIQDIFNIFRIINVSFNSKLTHNKLNVLLWIVIRLVHFNIFNGKRSPIGIVKVYSKLYKQVCVDETKGEW